MGGAPFAPAAHGQHNQAGNHQGGQTRSRCHQLGSGQLGALYWVPLHWGPEKNTAARTPARAK